MLGVRLPPCTAEGTPFEEMNFKDWESYYHRVVDDVVDAHVETLRSTSTAQLQCTAATTAGVLPPTDELRDLATVLLPWDTDEKIAALSELDMASVLVEFLREYECANLERSRRLSLSVNEREKGTLSGATTETSWDLGAFMQEMEKQRARITQELRIARPSLERTLDALGGLDQFRSIAVEEECLKRASLDLRNVAGLLADAAACVSKVPGKSSLRDPADLSQ